MITIDWILLAQGALAGAVASALFFAGLAWGMRRALRANRPAPVLLASSAIRIATLLGAGWLVASLGVAALAGFALAFMLVRFGVIFFARPPSATSATKEAAPWN